MGEIKVPQLGESVVEATVARWVKQPGEVVQVGDALLELETEKVNVEVAAEESGTLEKVLHDAGATVKVGEVVGVIGNGAASATSAAQDAAPAAQSGPAPASAPAAEEATVTPVARRLAEEHAIDPASIQGSGPGGRVTKEDVLSKIQPSAPPPAGDAALSRPLADTAASPTQRGAPPSERPVRAPAPSASPAVTAGPASGAPDGPGASVPGHAEATTPESATRFGGTQRLAEERIQLSRRRQTIARRLVEAQHTAAMLTTFNEVDMSAIMELRQRRRDSFKERHGVSLGFMSFFTRASIGALKAFPTVNAELDGDTLILKRYYDIGIAVSTDDGLVVPVLRDAGALSFAEIEKRIGDLATRARNRQLKIEDLQGGTFTITNGGVFGSLLSTPILNPPQVAILGMHKIEERPIALDGQVVVRPMMYLALTYDHRVIDGKEAVTFLVRIKELLESPETLLLEG